MPKIRLLLFSTFQIIRSALRQLLALADDIEIVGEAESILQAQQAIHKLHPSVILIETVDPDNAAITKLSEQTGRTRKIPLVVLSNHGDPRTVRAMLRLGVTGYVLKHASDAELLLAVRSAARGRKFLDAMLIDEIASEGAAPRRKDDEKVLLSKRERQVLMLLVKGNAGSAIAKELHLSVKTVETYRSRIYEKLEVHNRSELMNYAIAVGMITFDEGTYA
jgi:DNA-binding NarL/FixJ family response regulator